MSSPRSDDVYDNPALDEEGAFRAAEKPRGGIAMADMMQEEEDFGDVRIDHTMATEEDMADVRLIDAAVRENRQATRWDDMFQSLRTYVLVADDGRRTTYVLDSLRADLSFMERVEPYVCEGIHEEDLSRGLAGYQADYTIYTLALHPEWRYEPVEGENLLSLLPMLKINEQSADGLLKDNTDVLNASQAALDVVNQLQKAYKSLHKEMTEWMETNAIVRIDLAAKRCRAIGRTAEKVIRVAEQLYQDYEQYEKRGEIDATQLDRLPQLEAYLREVTKVAVFIHLDTERERERRYENGASNGGGGD
ncbi:hypothetical protein LTR56_022304 [Elasticomyces elasticus]|nr:hypothetical protein LTR56_022304 [Elasticomyces elasticus]KAK3637633.1 hypothetical protein LTR22_018196 [Elasticomyces elasticus]KAK4908703.1 hypothetical protein LTR49_022443 [Elasticomyces elasticus]KAK5748624.1 hypothetical protein LTS12_021326 [Elasticomyces elasticus]